MKGLFQCPQREVGVGAENCHNCHNCHAWEVEMGSVDDG